MALPKMQPSTVIGIGVGIGGIAAAVAHAITGDTTWTIAAGTAAAAITKVVLPDNSAEPDAVNKLVRDAVTAALSRNLGAALPVLLADGLAVVNGLQGTTQPAPASAPAAPTSAAT